MKTIQNCLGECDVVELVLRLVSTKFSRNLVSNAVSLGVAILEGGNKHIQDIFYQNFTQGNEKAFFREVRDFMVMTALELKSKRKLRKKLEKTSQMGSLHLPSTYDLTQGGRKADSYYEISDEKEIKFMTKLLRLSQLFCEGHHNELQVNFFFSFLSSKIKSII